MKKFAKPFALLLAACLCVVSVSAADGGFAEQLPAKSYILMEASTGQVLTENNADAPMPPASITKIMTMLLLMERIDAGEIGLDDMVTTSEHANSMGGTQIWLEVGEQMPVRDLLKATAVNSANDAAVALAEHMAGSEENFAALMNERAQQLGMQNTHFCNATGLDADGHVSTARDIAIMGRELLKHPAITEYTSIYMDSLRNGETELTNTNKMVRFYDGCNGLKTGTTDGAGSCLCASATRENMTLVAVSMGSATSAERFSSCRKLLDYGFGGWGLVKPELDASVLTPVVVEHGQKTEVGVRVEGEQQGVLLPKGGGKPEQQVQLAESVPAPVREGDQLGEVRYTVGGQEVAVQRLVAAETVEEMNFGFAFSGLWRCLFGG